MNPCGHVGQSTGEGRHLRISKKLGRNARAGSNLEESIGVRLAERVRA
jgi:hypothetical protein